MNGEGVLELDLNEIASTNLDENNNNNSFKSIDCTVPMSPTLAITNNDNSFQSTDCQSPNLSITNAITKNNNFFKPISCSSPISGKFSNNIYVTCRTPTIII